jgi:hypothetical protein
MLVQVLYADWDRLRALDDDRETLFDVMHCGKVMDPSFYNEVATVVVEADTILEALEKVFEDFNIGDGATSRRVRSMSVGDLVNCNGELWLCKSVGWKPVKGVSDAD